MRTQYRQNTPLTDIQLKYVAPSIFASEAHINGKKSSTTANIAVRDINGNWTLEKVVVKGWIHLKNFHFFVHGKAGDWTITEWVTGKRVLFGEKTKQHAIESLYSRFKTETDFSNIERAIMYSKDIANDPNETFN